LLPGTTATMYGGIVVTKVEPAQLISDGNLLFDVWINSLGYDHATDVRDAPHGIMKIVMAVNRKIGYYK